MAKINCPNCNQEYEVDESMQGQKVQCGVCDVCFSVRLEPSHTDSHTGNQSLPNDKSNDQVVTSNKSIAPATCPHCGNANAHGTIFCIFCGNAIESSRKCPACDTTLLAEARFCPKCGREVELNSDSKLSTNPKQMPAIISQFLSIGTRIKTAVYQLVSKKDDNSHSFFQKKMFKSPAIAFDVAFVLLVVVSVIVFYVKSQNGTEAKYNLGLRYYKGEDVKQDFDKAVLYFHEAAEQGHAEAQNALGECYYGGEGVKKSNIEAAKWFRKAAEQGLPKAQTYLGQCYYDGDGVKEDKEEAVKWFRKAAEQGYAEAQASLAGCYFDGYGVQKNIEMTAMWLRKAAEQGLAKAQVSLGLLYAMGEGVKLDYSEAVKWYRKAAEQGQVEAQFALGACYCNGQGVNVDITEGIKWYRLAADQGYKPARNQLNDLSKTNNFSKNNSANTKSNSVDSEELITLMALRAAATKVQAFGSSSPSTYAGQPVKCANCGGTGSIPSGLFRQQCPACHGTGYQQDIGGYSWK